MNIIAKNAQYVFEGPDAPYFAVYWLIQHDDGRRFVASRKYANKATANARCDDDDVLEMTREHFKRS